MNNTIFEMENIEKLASLVAEKELDEITITDGEHRVTIKGKKCPPPPHPHHPPMPPTLPSDTPSMMSAPAPSPTSPQSVDAAAGKVIKAPIVGTFYAAPSPDQLPFFTIGDTVHKGDTVFIIESMKLMNEVQSDVEGIVDQILVKNGDPVEYDQPIMILK